MDRTAQRVRFELAGRILVEIAEGRRHNMDVYGTGDADDASAHVQVPNAQPKRILLRSYDRHIENAHLQQAQHPPESHASVGEVCAERRLHIAARLAIQRMRLQPAP